ncbi:hypothetical protein MTO96_049776 [Rhipicephalus appendiculatus]
MDSNGCRRLACSPSDGLRLSFEGFALLVCHLRQLCFKNPRDASSTWEDHTTSIMHCNVTRTTKTQLHHDSIPSSEKVAVPTARMPISGNETITTQSTTIRTTAATASNTPARRAATSKAMTSQPSTSKASDNKASTSDAMAELIPTKKRSPKRCNSTQRNDQPINEKHGIGKDDDDDRQSSDM